MGNRREMDLPTARTVISKVAFCCSFLFLSGPILKADTAGTTSARVFEPGKEYHVITDNEAIGTQSFNVYVPVDYTDDRSWPVIFLYMGRGEKYNPITCHSGRMITCDRGAIVVGMGYLNAGTAKIKAAEFIQYVDAELRSIYEAKELISRHLKIDNDRLFISGTSAGGWLASLLLEYRAQFWAGALIFVAGRHRSADLLTNPDSVMAFRGMPVFFGSSLPPASHGVNHKWARVAERLYRRRGAIVEFQIYQPEWLVCCPLLRDWTGAYILDNKTDSIRTKIAKKRQITRAGLEELDSTRIVKHQMAKQLGRQVDQLTKGDLAEIRELSLMGENVSDAAYIANLTNLESLDLSFTYVDRIEPLLECRNLRKLNISGTRVKDVTPLKNLLRLDSLSMWNVWVDQKQIDELEGKLPNLKTADHQCVLYELDSIGRVVPRLKVTLN